MHISRLHTGLVWTDALSCLYLSTNKEQNWIKASGKQAHALDTICGSEKKEKKTAFNYKQGNMQSLINKPPVSPFHAQPFWNMKGNTEEKNNNQMITLSKVF